MPEAILQPLADWLAVAIGDNYGEFAVFVSRCLPVVRTFISFPAGTARMNLARFTFYTLLGCVPWVFAHTYFGYLLGENWEKVGSFLHYLDYVVVLALVMGGIYLFAPRRY